MVKKTENFQQILGDKHDENLEKFM